MINVPDSKPEKKKPEPLKDPELIKLRNKILQVIELVPRFYRLNPTLVQGFTKVLDEKLAEHKDRIPQVYRECEAVMFGPLEDYGLGNIMKMLDLVNDRLKIKEGFRWIAERSLIKGFLDGSDKPEKLPVLMEEIRKIFRR